MPSKAKTRAERSPPRAQVRPETTELHGEVRVDPYAWLRDDNWQVVMREPDQLRADIRAYLEQENGYCAAMMEDAQAAEAAIFAEIRNRIKEDDSSVPEIERDWAYYYRFREGGEHPIYCRCPAVDAFASERASESVLLDGDELAIGQSYMDLGGVDNSPDHRLLAYAIDTNGSEIYTIVFRDLASGNDSERVIQGAVGSFQWANDSQTLFYVKLDDNHRPSTVWRHRVGSEQDDELVYEEADPGFFVGLGKTESERFITIDAHDHVTSEVWLLDADEPSGEPRLVSSRVENTEYNVTHHGDKLLIVTNADGAEDYKIVRAPLDDPSRENWQEWIPHRPGSLIVDIVATNAFIARLERVDALPRIVVCEVATGEEHIVEFAEQAYSLSMSSAHEYGSEELRFTYSSPTTPSQVYDYHMRRRSRVLRKEQEVPSGHEPADYTARRLMVSAPDGEQVPVTLVHRSDREIGPHTPVFLYGYGSYGHSIPAAFSVSRLPLVDRGFVYAIAHIRGGMERGYRWYRTGKLGDKRNTFTDFIACAEGLAQAGIGRVGNFVCHGGSAGGMLIGAVINMRPDLFRAAIADVPFVDVLNTMCDKTLPLTPPEWPEWGNPIDDKAVYKYIAGYSPYDNVRAQAYPNLFVTAGLTDPRVTYWEPAKWVARLRELKTDDHLLLFKTNMDAGHGGAAGRFERLHEVAQAYAFVLKVYDMLDGTAT